MKKIVIISGGMDSTTLLYDVVAKFGGENVLALSFDYGSRHNKMELPLASQTCLLLGVEHKIFDLKEIFSNFNSALLDKEDSEPIPEGHYAEANMKKTVVPFRNGILLSLAVGFAESQGADSVYYGAHLGDHDIYPDCRKQFVTKMNEASILGTYNKVSVLAPYENENKTTIIEKGIDLGVDYNLTWTCYNPKEDGQPCGKCGSCVERTEAFVENNLQDPKFSDNNWKEAVAYMEKVTKKDVR